MSYQLYEVEELPGGIKRIAYAEIDDALGYLQVTDGKNLDDAVHETRKCLKKLRGLLRLVRKEIGEEVYKRENICFRDAGRLLSDLRDSRVMIDVFDDIISHIEDDLDRDKFDAIREGLQLDYEATRSRVIKEEQATQKASDMLRAARLRVSDWPVETQGYKAVAGGLQKVYKRGRNRLDDAEEEQTAEAFHEWRKRVKYLWYNIRILQPLWPDLFDELADQIHDLSDYLGDEHDLAEFLDLIENRPIRFSDNDSKREVLLQIEERRANWQEQAFVQGKRVYAESPDEFIARIEAYWHASPQN